MLKLISRYEDAPTISNARKIVAHAVKHPMALTFLTADQTATVYAARAAIENS
jgi:hypothetical protein